MHTADLRVINTQTHTDLGGVSMHYPISCDLVVNVKNRELQLRDFEYELYLHKKISWTEKVEKGFNVNYDALMVTFEQTG